MKYNNCFWSILPALCLLLCACGISGDSISETSPVTESTDSDTQSISETATASSEAATLTETTSTTTTTTTETTAPPETLPVHSPLYLEGVSVEDVLLYFNEVCLASEYSYGGDSSLVQKWTQPIYYNVYGNTTPEDLEVLADTVEQLNAIAGFPGIMESQDMDYASIPIYFCDETELVDRMGDDYVGCWGATTFWYEENEIYEAVICIRNDIDQLSRDSIIIEEIYNTLGPVQDTEIRMDSIIYQHSNDNLSMSEIDVLLLRLLYHPEIACGMNTDECEAVIRSLYF